MSKLWSPYNLYNNLKHWYDASDPYDNNSQSTPTTEPPASLATGDNWDYDTQVSPWKDKSLTRQDLFAPNGLSVSQTKLRTPRYGVGTIKSMAITTAGNGIDYLAGTVGADATVRLGFVPLTPLVTANKANSGGSGGTGNTFTPFSVSANITLVSSQVNTIHGVFSILSCSVGDTFFCELGGGQQGVVLTVTEIYEHAIISHDNRDHRSIIHAVDFTRLRFFMVFDCTAQSNTGVTPNDDPIIQIADANGVKNISLAFDFGEGSLQPFTSQDMHIKAKYKDTGGSARVSSGLTVPLCNRVLCEFVISSSAPYVQEFINGTLTDSTSTTNALDLPAKYAFRVGGDEANSGVIGTHNSCEFVVVDESSIVLTNDERNLFNGYLAHKWQVDLVSGHAYENAAPTLQDAQFFGGAHKLSPREPVQMVKMYLDECDNVFGIVDGLSTCNATPSTGNECYNTKHTCLNLSKYRVNSNGKKEITFSQEVGNNLAGFESSAHPALISVTSAPSEIQPTKGVSVRSNITIKMRDFISDDKGIDPYFSTRSIIALENGTFFQKLLARNPHYYGRPIEIYDGFFDFDGTPQVHDGKREYIIESLHLDNDICTIKCKDPMSLADDLKSKVPVPSDFSFKIAVTTGTKNNEVLTIGGADATAEQLQAEFGTSGFVRVNEEIMGYTRSAGDANMDFASSARGDWGTVEASHSAGDTVQKCLAFGTYNDSSTGSTIDDVAYEIFVNGAGVPAGAINKTTGGEYSWADEKTNWLSTFKINTVISEPEEANKLVNQLGSMVGTNFFYDDLAARIVMKAEMPIVDPLTIQTITDIDIVEDSLKIINAEKDRVSRVYYYYNRKNGIEDRDKKKSFRNLYVNIDADSEGSEEYARQSNKVIYGWGVNDSSTATSVSQRILNRFKNVPKTVSFKLDVGSKQVKTGDHFYLQTKSIVNLDGGITARTEMQCIFSKFNDKLQAYEIKAQQFRFTGANFGQVTANILSVTAAGSGYAVDNTMTFTGGSNSATGLTCKVTSVNGSNGVTGVEITAIGDLNTASKYVVGDVLTEGGGTNSGSGCQVTIGREYFLGEGSGTGTDEDSYTGARLVESYICDNDLEMSNGSEPYRIV